MVTYQLFPKYVQPSNDILELVDLFESRRNDFDSAHFDLKSNDVLGVLAGDLLQKGYLVEMGKRNRIKVPVLFGRNGRVEKSFDADAYHVEKRIVLEVEAGRAVANYQFLKDLFQASMMLNVNTLAIAVRQIYKRNKDFETIVNFMETLYASTRLTIPLKQILIIGY